MTIKSQVKWLKVDIKDLQAQIKKLLKKPNAYELDNLTQINLLRHKIRVKEFKIKNIERGFPELGYWDNGAVFTKGTKAEILNDAAIE